jgi:hypothetical protein
MCTVALHTFLSTVYRKIDIRMLVPAVSIPALSLVPRMREEA